MTLPLLPVWISDFIGSALMIVFSFMCVSLARRIRRENAHNVVWTYLVWVSYSLAGFAVSRSFGHIAKRLLVGMGYPDTWEMISPYSGSVNTLSFFVVASITLFFERIWKIYGQISRDKLALQKTHGELVFLNRNLETLVAERTRELAASERKFRRMFEVSRDLVAVVLPSGTVVEMNPAGREMLGIANGAPQPVPSFRSFFQTEGEWDSVMGAVESMGFSQDTELSLKRTDGASFSALLSCAAERRRDGSVAAVHCMIKDISQRKAMEQQLLQADKLASIGQLAAGIAHEINNPLNVILGYTQLLLRKEQEGTQTHADHKVIEKHARTCKSIVSDLLSFSRSARTKKRIGHLHTALEEVLGVLRHHFELDGVVIATELDPRIPSMVMDEEKMKQVFMNLLMNAKQAIGKKGSIELATRFDSDDAMAFVEVRDSGAGIDPQNLPRIFDPFFTTKPTGEGTGLGLSVSYGIVKDHCGEILVDSEPGKGSIFTVVLPVVTGEDSEQC